MEQAIEKSVPKCGIFSGYDYLLQTQMVPIAQDEELQIFYKYLQVAKGFDLEGTHVGHGGQFDKRRRQTRDS